MDREQTTGSNVKEVKLPTKTNVKFPGEIMQKKENDLGIVGRRRSGGEVKSTTMIINRDREVIERRE